MPEHKIRSLPCIAAEDGINLQNWLLCVEMLPSAIFMIFAFPWTEYVVAGGNIRGGNITHAISIRCVAGRNSLAAACLRRATQALLVVTECHRCLCPRIQ